MEKFAQKSAISFLRLQVHSREEKRRYKFLQDLVISIFSTQILSKDIFFCNLKVVICHKWKLNALEWDGVPRVAKALHHFLGCEESELVYESLKIFMLGAINRIFYPGCKFEIMLCLVGKQGDGKSTFFRLLAMKDDWFSDDLKRLDDENVVRKMSGHWIIENG